MPKFTSKLTVMLATVVAATVFAVVPVTPASAATGNWIDSTNRSQVEQLVAAISNNTMNTLASGWNGSVASCNAGSTSQAYRNQELQATNQLRSLAGVAPVTENATYTQKAQAAALIIAANQTLSHNPSSSAKCYSSNGAAGSSNSNLAFGVGGPSAAAMYVADPGTNNLNVGHRYWLMNPKAGKFGFGDITYNGTPYNATYVIDFSGSGYNTRSGGGNVYWPSEGYFPADWTGNLWSVQNYDSSRNFSNATVTLASNGKNIPVTVNHRAADRITYQPTITTPKNVDTKYTVTIGNVSGGNISYSFTAIPDPTATTTSGGYEGDGYNASVPQLWYRFQVARLYSAYFERYPDPSGWSYWNGKHRFEYVTLGDMSNYFTQSDEFISTYGSSLSNNAFITLVYNNVLDRTPDQAGLDYWNYQMSRGMTRGELMIYFGESAEFTVKAGPEITGSCWNGNVVASYSCAAANAPEPSYNP